MEKFSLTGMAVQPQLPLGSFIILMLRKIRDAPVMEIRQDTHSFHHSCARVRSFLLGLGNDSWALGNGERHTAVPAGARAPKLYVLLVTWVVNQA